MQENRPVKAEELIAQASSLPVKERVLIADSILRTLNPPESDIDQKWAQVAKRRLAELQDGQVHAVPGTEVFARIWERFTP